MPAVCLKLRSDLIFSRQETSGGGVVFVLKDPEAGRFLRFKEPEYFLAQQLDGQTPLEEVRRRGRSNSALRWRQERWRDSPKSWTSWGCWMALGSKSNRSPNANRPEFGATCSFCGFGWWTRTDF